MSSDSTATRLNIPIRGSTAPGNSISSGLLIVALTSVSSFQISQILTPLLISPMIIAVIIGILYTNIVGISAGSKVGIRFCQTTLLRLAIVLLGFQITLQQFASIGIIGLFTVVGVLIATFLFTVQLGRYLRVERDLSFLIAAGTSICGASAVVAADAVVRAKDENVSYAVACITIFGTIAMFGFPLLGFVADLSEQDFGLWAGASIHEIAQVVGATFQYGQISGEIGTVSKMVRVAMLAPIIVVLGLLISHGAASDCSKRPSTPWFAVWFVVAMAVNSVLDVPHAVRGAIASTAALLLTVGLAAMGLQTNVAAVRLNGFRPLLLALLASAFIASSSLALIILLPKVAG